MNDYLKKRKNESLSSPSLRFEESSEVLVKVLESLIEISDLGIEISVLLAVSVSDNSNSLDEESDSLFKESHFPYEE